jgi:hypothetical protein
VFEDLLPAWGGEEVVVRFDEPSATWMFVCVHSTVLGPGAGRHAHEGVRRAA